jgi:hypothetical protein
MSVAEQESMLLVMAVAAACAVPGVFLVLRRLALVGDAISHVLLFGIVIAYFVVKDLQSPWLMVGAAASGVLTVALVEALQRTRLVHGDTAIGLVFPALFALGTLLASMYLRGTHLDVDRVLLGSAEYASRTEPVIVGNSYFGRKPTLIMAGVFLFNVILTVLLYKELKLTTFDPALAATLGFLPGTCALPAHDSRIADHRGRLRCGRPGARGCLFSGTCHHGPAPHRSARSCHYWKRLAGGVSGRAGGVDRISDWHECGGYGCSRSGSTVWPHVPFGTAEWFARPGTASLASTPGIPRNDAYDSTCSNMKAHPPRRTRPAEMACIAICTGHPSRWSVLSNERFVMSWSSRVEHF